ncbi:hypothetical protein SARC_00075 [Sphaeroforma arctica JP610]|uniref:Uncharacterized protein n=1 Tax=Sphaeroforma arctica JP610 TaxID=667725 RepID=A0A0L0GHJ6_9EUKA|nr:hypothetical protein SARC_00075 [Sphaeroforma arctica JP610]KNC87818.1 hypothetical protein SARC_00075 [Sphaeroforma arctica JP610]|eukprot:XP_014161720.1 hypothetical protein SARC_00075 [Sphaeroforma arctica JP610]
MASPVPSAAPQTSPVATLANSHVEELPNAQPFDLDEALISPEVSISVDAFRALFTCDTCAAVTADIGYSNCCLTNICRSCATKVLCCTKCPEGEAPIFNSPMAKRLLKAASHVCGRCTMELTPLTSGSHTCDPVDYDGLATLTGAHEQETVMSTPCSLGTDVSRMPASSLIGKTVVMWGTEVRVDAGPNPTNYMVVSKTSDASQRFKVHMHSLLHLYGDAVWPSIATAAALQFSLYDAALPTAAPLAKKAAGGGKVRAPRFRPVPKTLRTAEQKAMYFCKLTPEAVAKLHEPTPGYVWRVERIEQLDKSRDVLRYRARQYSEASNTAHGEPAVTVPDFGPESYLAGTAF